MRYVLASNNENKLREMLESGALYVCPLSS